jgi:hypothetical protein
MQVSPRDAVAVTDMTELGQTCRQRALLEGERRWCGNKTEQLTGAPITLSDRQLLATVLDLRTMGCVHLDADQRAAGLRLLKAEYAIFALQCEEYDAAELAKNVAVITPTGVLN